MTAPTQRICYGLPAGWLTGWLAAVGATVIDRDLRLSWTDEETPIAVFTHRNAEDPAEVLSARWPRLKGRLDDMPGARDPSKNKNDPTEIGVKVFAARLEAARNHADAFSLTSSLTDLNWETKGQSDVAVYGPFEIAGTGPMKWLHHRCRKVYDDTVGDYPTRIAQLFNGVAERVEGSGLGLDAGRIGAVRDSGEKPMVDPVAETLAYFALALFPVRGDGKQVKAIRGRQRGWGVGPFGDSVFIWPAWKQPLDRWGIDALLTAWHNTWRRNRKGEWRTSQAKWDLLGVHAGWETTSYRAKKGSDRTRGLGSRSIDPYDRPTRSSNRGY